MGIHTSKLTKIDVANLVKSLGEAYVSYEAGIIKNCVDGDVIYEGMPEVEIAEVFDLVGVTNNVHKRKIRATLIELSNENATGGGGGVGAPTPAVASTGGGSSSSSVAPGSFFVLSAADKALRLSGSARSADYVTPLSSGGSSDLNLDEREIDNDNDNDSDSDGPVDGARAKRARVVVAIAAGGGGLESPPSAVRGKSRVYTPVSSIDGSCEEYNSWRAALFVPGAILRNLSKGTTQKSKWFVRESYYCPIKECNYTVRLSNVNDSWGAVLEESGVHEHDTAVSDGLSPTGRGLIQYYRTKVDDTYALNKFITVQKLLHIFREELALLTAGTAGTAGTHVHPIPSDRQVSRYLMRVRTRAVPVFVEVAGGV